MGRWTGRKDKLLSRLAGNRVGGGHLEELIPETSLEMDREHYVGRRETGRMGDATVFALDPFEWHGADCGLHRRSFSELQ